MLVTLPTKVSATHASAAGSQNRRKSSARSRNTGSASEKMTSQVSDHITVLLENDLRNRLASLNTTPGEAFVPFVRSALGPAVTALAGCGGIEIRIPTNASEAQT